MIVELGTDRPLGVRARSAVVYAGDYLNKLTGEQIERECKNKLLAGYNEIVVNFAGTQTINSIGISILLGVIDSAARSGARVVFSDVNQDTVELLEMLGITKHVDIREW